MVPLPMHFPHTALHVDGSPLMESVLWYRQQMKMSCLTASSRVLSSNHMDTSPAPMSHLRGWNFLRKLTLSSVVRICSYFLAVSDAADSFQYSAWNLPSSGWTYSPSFHSCSTADLSLSHSLPLFFKEHWHSFLFIAATPGLILSHTMKNVFLDETRAHWTHLQHYHIMLQTLCSLWLTP
jgi:hypothetical protein